MREGIVVGRPTRGVRAEPVGRGDRHADIALEGPCKHAAVQNPPGAGSLNEGEATMGNCPPHMVPGGATPAVAQRSEDVRAVREACPGRPPSSGSLEAMRSATDGRGIDGWRGNWEVGVAASVSSRPRFRVGSRLYVPQLHHMLSL
jgi:hypothetical protein